MTGPATTLDDTGMTREQRRAIIALCAIIAGTYLLGTSMTFALAPMSTDLGMTSAQGELVLALPSIAAVFLVFTAGRLGDRLGYRPMIFAFAVPFTLGALIVTAASSGTVAAIGIALAGGCAGALQVLSVGLLQRTFPTGRARVSAFTSIGMLFPAVSVLVPPITGHAVELVSWRWVPAVWAVAGALIPLFALLLPRPGGRKPLGEMVTPVLAGLVLSGLVSSINHRHEDGILTLETAGPLLVSLASLVTLTVLMRRLPRPSLSLAPLRIPRVGSLIAAVILVTCVNTLVYVTIGVQYLYALSSLYAAWALLPAQVGAVLGAKVAAGWAMRRFGTLRAGLLLLPVFAISYLTLLVVQSSSPIWVPVAAATLFSICGAATSTVVNTALMGRAPDGQQGLMASYRGAASALGSSMSVVVLGSGIIDAANKQETSGTLDVTELVNGIHTDGIVGAAVVALAFAVYAWKARGATDG